MIIRNALISILVWCVTDFTLLAFVTCHLVAEFFTHALWNVDNFAAFSIFSGNHTQSAVFTFVGGFIQTLIAFTFSPRHWWGCWDIASGIIIRVLLLTTFTTMTFTVWMDEVVFDLVSIYVFFFLVTNLTLALIFLGCITRQAHILVEQCNILFLKWIWVADGS